MEADRWMNGDKTADLVALLETLDHVIQRSVSQSVAVVREKDLFVLDEMSDRYESLPDIAPSSGVYKCNAPIWWRLTQNLNRLAEIRDDAVAGCRLLVAQKIVFD